MKDVPRRQDGKGQKSRDTIGKCETEKEVCFQ